MGKLLPVQTLRLKLQCGVWLALAAMLALSLVPTLSQALAHSRGDISRWAEVCTPQGMKQVLVQAESAADEGATAPVLNLFDHCAYCTISSYLAPPPSPAAVVNAMDLGRYLPRLFLQAPRSTFAWSSAQPRAPPTRS